MRTVVFGRINGLSRGTSPRDIRHPTTTLKWLTHAGSHAGRQQVVARALEVLLLLLDDYVA